MNVPTILFIFLGAIVGAQQTKLSKRDEKLLRFRKEVDKIAEDLENFAFDLAKEIVEKTDLYPDYDYEDYPEEQLQANRIPKDQARRKRSVVDPEQCKKPQAEQHLEKLHIEDLKEEIRHLYELVTILRDQQRILAALDQEKDARRFDPKELLRMLEDLNDNGEDKDKPFSTHRELAKIKADLRRAVAALDQTKAVLVQDRRQEMNLEAELQLLRGRNATAAPANDSLVGLPQPKRTRSSGELQDLARLLDQIEKPKASKLRLLVQLLERAKGREEEEEDSGVEEELRRLQSAIERLRPKEEAADGGLDAFLGGRGRPGDAKLTRQQLVELRRRLDQMISSGAAASGQPASNFATANAPLPFNPFWYANYRNSGPYPNNQAPTAYGYDRGQYGPEQTSPFAGLDASRYRPENNPYGRDFWMNRHRYTTDPGNRFFPATLYFPEDSGAGDPGQAGPHLPPDYRTKDVEELKNQIDNLQDVIDSMRYQNYGKGPEDAATVADLERQIKDLRGIVNGFNQEVYSQQASSINQPPPSFNQSPPTYNQPLPSHEALNETPQQPYDAHQVIKRSAVPQNNPPSGFSHSAASFNQPPPTLSQPPSSHNQLSPNQLPQNIHQMTKRSAFPENKLPSSFNKSPLSHNEPSSNQIPPNNTHQITKRSAVPENSSSALNTFFKPKTYLFEDSRIGQNDLNSPSYNQPLAGYEPPLSFNDLPPSFNQPLPSYKQYLPSYSYNEPPQSYSHPFLSFSRLLPSNNQPPPSYSQFFTSYEPPLSYNKPPLAYSQPLPSPNQRLLSYRQPPAGYNQPLPGRSSTDSQLLDEVYSKLKSYLLEDDQTERSSSHDAVGETMPSLEAQLDSRHKSYADPQPLGMSPRAYSPYGYTQKSLLPPQKNDLLGAIIVKVIDKIVAALPEVLDKSFGVVGLVPAVLLKLIGGLEAFVGVLRGNKFFRGFLMPVLVLLVVAGSVVFLVWWLQDDVDYKQIGYDQPPDQGFGYPNSYYRSGGARGYPAPGYLPGYSRSYYENNQKLNEN